MKSNKIFFAVSALALLSGATLAQAGTYSLAPAGQGPIDGPVATHSAVSRGQVRSEFAQARMAGELVPAGQGQIGNRPSTTSIVARADVKRETLQARNDGALVPAGEGPIDSAIVAHQGRATTPMAFYRRDGRTARSN